MNESQTKLLDDINNQIALNKDLYKKVVKKIDDSKTKKSDNYKKNISKLKSERDSLKNNITLLKTQKNLLEELISYERELKEISIISLIEKLLNVKLSKTLGYVVDYEKYGGIPTVLYKDVDTLNNELSKMCLDLDTLYENGKISLEAHKTMKKTLRKVYSDYRKNAPKIDNIINIRNTHEFSDFVKVTKQSVTPSKKKSVSYVEFISMQKDEVKVNKDFEITNRLKDLEIRSRELGLSKNNFDNVVKKEMKLHKAA